MSKRKVVLSLAVFMLITVLVGQSLCSSGVRGGRRTQQGAQQGQRGGERTERGQMMRNPEQMQNMMLERMKTQLKVSDAKWTTVKPLLKKVGTLNAQLNPRSRGAMMYGGRGGMGMGGQDGRGGMGPRGAGGRGGRGGAGQPPTANTPKTDVEKATTELQTALRAETPKADQIKAKLAALRTAKEKVKKDLAKAEADLKKQLTPEQEANLVLMGQIS